MLGENSFERLKKALDSSDAVFLGLGAGASAAAGFEYSGRRFERYFNDFALKYHFSDMYSGGFYPFKSLEEKWAYWSRYIFINRYMDAPRPFYDNLYRLADGKDYFVLTTNVDHCVLKAGFDKSRIFYTQGDYGLWQCSGPCHDETYDNEDSVVKMVLAQGFLIHDGELDAPAGTQLKMEVPKELVPYCPVCGRPMAMNLRADDTFVQDAGWRTALSRYEDFVRRHKNHKMLYMEIGVGFNTPGIVKYNFWNQVRDNPNAVYACLNMTEALAPEEILDRSILIEGDSYEAVLKLLNRQGQLGC